MLVSNIGDLNLFHLHKNGIWAGLQLCCRYSFLYMETIFFILELIFQYISTLLKCKYESEVLFLYITLFKYHRSLCGKILHTRTLHMSNLFYFVKFSTYILSNTIYSILSTYKREGWNNFLSYWANRILDHEAQTHTTA